MVDIKVKNKLIKRIKQIENNEVINELNRLLDIEIDEDIYITNSHQKKVISESLDQIKYEKVLSEEKSNKNAEECLQRKK